MPVKNDVTCRNYHVDSGDLVVEELHNFLQPKILPSFEAGDQLLNKHFTWFGQASRQALANIHFDVGMARFMLPVIFPDA